MTPFPRLVALACFSAILSHPIALADNASAPHWTQDPDRIWSVDSSDAGSDTDFFSFSRIIRSSGGPGPVIILNCQVNSRGKQTLGLGFQIDPDNDYMDDPDRSPRILTASGVLTIDGKKKSERFRYHPDSTRIVPFDRSVPRRVFNAVVNDADITLKFRSTVHDLNVPPVDNAFKSFAKVCPVTNGGEFDMTLFDRIDHSDTRSFANE